MTLDFPQFDQVLDRLDNYDLFLMPNGIYRAKEIEASNYLYPMYYLKEGDEYVVSTSVYALIRYKKRFVRNPNFQTTYFFRPTYQTIDAEIMRVRTTLRRSSKELNDPDEIAKLGVRLMVEYVKEIEEKFPEHVHILLMGGKDSQNIALIDRSKRWIIVSAAPNADINEAFLAQNEIKVERFIKLDSVSTDEMINEEIQASDCCYDVSHFWFVKTISDLAKEYDGKIVLWQGTSGDGCFAKNNNHRDIDYYAVHDLHVGMSMGINHQIFKNLLNIPAVSPYQSPQFLDELFYRYDPYYVVKSGDIRKKMGEMLFGKPVIYPESNPEPRASLRNRKIMIPTYLDFLEKDGIRCENHVVKTTITSVKENIHLFFRNHSIKRRTPLSKLLYPIRIMLSRVFPSMRNRRFDIAATEIK